MKLLQVDGVYQHIGLTPYEAGILPTELKNYTNTNANFMMLGNSDEDKALGALGVVMDNVCADYYMIHISDRYGNGRPSGDLRGQKIIDWYIHDDEESKTSDMFIKTESGEMFQLKNIVPISIDTTLDDF